MGTKVICLIGQCFIFWKMESKLNIGESNHVKNRMSQHHSSVDKRIFDKVHFIYSSKFNQSVTFDYESKLIQYIVADELYEVRNKNAGMADKEYYGKKRI